MYNMHFFKSTLLISSIGILTACGSGGAETDTSASAIHGSTNTANTTESATGSNSTTHSPVSGNEDIAVNPTSISGDTKFTSPTEYKTGTDTSSTVTSTSTSETDTSSTSNHQSTDTTTSSGNNSTTPSSTNNEDQTAQTTHISEGIIYASSTGTGTGVSADDPSSLQEALNALQGGDVLFLRGGVYTLSMSDLKKVLIPSSASGSSSKPTIIESYPGEKAVIDGSALSKAVNAEREQGSIRVEADYVKVRKIEVRNMPEFGILVTGNNVVVEECESHHNGLTGIFAHHVSNILVQNNITHHNSDVGLGVNKWNYDNGDNADGIAVAYSNNSTIRHNIAYLNSDDGIDVWGSNNMLVTANKVYKNGYLDNGSHAGKGNGNGIKAGGENTHDNVISYNLIWQNYANGIDISEKSNLRAKYIHNTTWHNGYNGSSNIYQLGRGYTFNPDTELQNNISSDDAMHFWNDNGIFIDNSWDRGNHSWEDIGTVPFINTTNPSSPDFLRPAPGSGYEDLGAYAGN